MKRLIIDRSRWFTGSWYGAYRSGWSWNGTSASSALLRRDGTMCCLGFLARDCGIPETSIRFVPSPKFTDAEYDNRWPQGTFDMVKSTTRKNSQLIAQMISVNDDVSLLNEEREGRLRELFLRLDYEVEFINNYPWEQPHEETHD